MFGDGCRMCALQVYTHEVELCPNNREDKVKVLLRMSWGI
jgi:hypothetical protein